MTEWVALGTDTMTAAQKAKGLSNERLARLLNISEKTWRRWRERGGVPVHELPHVAQALDLEIEEPERVRVSVDGQALDSEFQDKVLAALSDVRAAVARVEAAMDEQSEQPPQARPASR